MIKIKKGKKIGILFSFKEWVTLAHHTRSENSPTNLSTRI